MSDPQPIAGDTPGRHWLSIVVPVYNEEEVLPDFHARLSSVVAGLDVETNIIYVNDGSKDRSLEIMLRLRASDSRVCVVDLSRNFGKEIALTAGLDLATGDAVVVIDADLQDPPELIPKLVSSWREGNDVVYAQRTSRQGESVLKKATSFAFYRVIQRMTRVRIPEDTGDFRLMSRQVVAALRQLRERNRFMKGLFAWVGYRQVAVPYERHPRHAGTTKWNYWRLWNFAIEGFTSFTTAPLRIATYIGIAIAAWALIYAGVVIYKTLAFGEPVRGYPSLMVVILFLGGAQLTTIGVLGEYVGRMFDETKGRPLYLIQSYFPPERASQGAPSVPD